MKLIDQVNSIPDNATVWVTIEYTTAKGDNFIMRHSSGFFLNPKEFKAAVNMYRNSRWIRFKLWMKNTLNL